MSPGAVFDEFAHLLRKRTEIDPHKAEQQRARGEAADRLLNDELLSDAFQRVEQVYLDAWRRSDALDFEMRELSWKAVQLLADLRNQLMSEVRTGELASRHLLRTRPE